MAFRNSNSSTSAPATTAATKPEGEALPVRPADTYIWGIYGALVFCSIVELYSASSFEIATQGLYGPLIRHMGFLALGFILILAIQRIHFRSFAWMGALLWWGSAILMLIVPFFGVYVNGARRAISLGFMLVQPAEFLKLSTALYLAIILSRTQLKKSEGLRNRGIVQAVAVVAVSSALLFTQGLTNTLILVGISLSMMLIGAIEWRKFGIVMICFAILGGSAAAIKMSMTKDDVKQEKYLDLYDAHGTKFQIANVNALDGGNRIDDHTWGNRIKRWRNDSIPKYDQPLTQENLQEQRSFMAQAHGGVFGVWPGNSRETARLPLAFSDYIFAIIVEDLGLVGGLFIMLFYLCLLGRAYYIAARCTKAFPAFLVTGMAVLITLQALCHMAIVSGAGPVSGQPLPLFSKGGTSILVTSIAFGIMLSVSRYAVRSDDKKSVRTEGSEALPEEIRAENPIQF